MVSINLLPRGQHDIEFGYLNQMESVIFGLSYTVVKEILEAMQIEANLTNHDDLLFLNCRMGDLSFTTSLIGEEDKLIDNDKEDGTFIRCVARYSVVNSTNNTQESPDNDTELLEISNEWNQTELIGRSSVRGDQIFLDMLIPCDGITSGNLTATLFEWIDLNAAFVEYLTTIVSPPDEDGEEQENGQPSAE